MPRTSDELTDTFKCPECGHEITESLSRLKNDPTLVCPACGVKIQYASGGTLRKVTDQLDDIDRLLDKIGKG